MKNHSLIQQEYWDSVAESNKALRNSYLPFPAFKERELFFKFAGFKKGDKILEIGCGTGRYTLDLLRMECRLYATDISEKSLEVLKKSAEEEKLDSNLVLGNDTFEDKERCQEFFNKFDYAIFIGVIHHLNPAKKKAILTNVVNSIKKGGKVVILEPNPLNPLYYFLYLWRGLANIEGKNRWQTEKGFLKSSLFSLRSLFRSIGLQKIEVKRYAWFPSKCANYFPVILRINDALNKIPFLKEMSAFIWIKGEKY